MLSKVVCYRYNTRQTRRLFCMNHSNENLAFSCVQENDMMKVSSINFPICSARRTNVALSVRQSAALAFRVAATDSARLCCSLERACFVSDEKMISECSVDVCAYDLSALHNRTYLF